MSRKVICRLVMPLLLGGCAFAVGDEPKFDWSATSTSSVKLHVPADGKSSLVVFVRPNQQQSQAVLEKVRAAAQKETSLQIIIVINSDEGAPPASALPLDPKWPLVLDPEFKASGDFNVHAWPTTVLVKPTGEQAAHIAGLSDSFANDLENSLQYASGKIDADALKKRIGEHNVVSDDSEQKANRRLILARQLLESGHPDQARVQLEEGLALRPDQPDLMILMIQVLILEKAPDKAIVMLEQLPENALPTFTRQLLRGKALIAQEKWDEAKKVLPDAIKLNPRPAEAHYLMGTILAHSQEWKQAAEEFRLAYESGPATHR